LGRLPKAEATEPAPEVLGEDRIMERALRVRGLISSES
jgi:hypothetical protein